MAPKVISNLSKHHAAVPFSPPLFYVGVEMEFLYWWSLVAAIDMDIDGPGSVEARTE